ncbi:MAG: endonuclease/exonuclease/phosphatase family protein [Panacagrimonas sp.]
MAAHRPMILTETHESHPTPPTGIAAEPSCAVPLTLKILTLNTHKGFTTFNRRFVLHELREAIRSVGADLVFLQEVLGDDATARPARVKWPSIPQYEFLADSLWPHFSYGRNAVYPAGHHGNALLSKFPIVSYQNTDISITGPERRGMLHCVLRAPGWSTDVHAICVHLGLVAAHRAQQVDLACDLMETLPGNAPLILAGDFNDWQQHAGPVLRRRAGLEEAFAGAHGRPARTFPAVWPLLRLDRIYCRNATASHPMVLSKAPWSRLSDHAGLLAEVCL